MDENNSETMDLENMQKKYSNLFIQYKKAVADYINHLSKTNDQFTTIKGVAYVGTGIAGDSTATTLQKCQAECSENTKCKGATFVSGKCSLRTGDTSIIQSSDDSYAIVPMSKKLLLHVERLNQQLLDVNKQISDKVNALEPIYYTYEDKNKEASKELIHDYKELELERENISKLLDQYNTLETSETDYQNKTTQHYYSYLLLLLLTIFIIYLFIKITALNTSSTIQYAGGALHNETMYYIIGGIICVTLFVQYFSLNGK